ncbi:MFS transporter [Devosia sp.]|uniref:MFS transporter n=1 Tax=Devosia sp. TaxID=1871048 RepID=UPI003A94B3B9
MTQPAPTADRTRLAFSYRNFRFFWFTTACSSFAAQIMSVSVGWQVYDLTRNPLFLGLVGLAQFMPALLLVLVTGLAADRFRRRRIMQLCLVVELGCATALLFFATISGQHEVWPIFIILVVLGTARAFLSPAGASLAPNLVPPVALANAVSMNATAWQLAGIVGPMVGGLLYGVHPYVAYGAAAVLVCAALVSISMVSGPSQRTSEQQASLETLLAGFRYIFHEKVVLGAISLDLFAVLMGGAVALMPVFARDILETGPWGLGLLRAAPGFGAIFTALLLSRLPIRDRAGVTLFIFVALFGLFTCLFGLSTSIWFSVPLLALVGACDMVSVSIRETIMQLWTPDHVRGRVNAVNSVFIGASNELGEFRAGLMAFFIGTQAAVALGGAATMGVAGAWSVMFPGLRRQRSLDRAMVQNP